MAARLLALVASFSGRRASRLEQRILSSSRSLCSSSGRALTQAPSSLPRWRIPPPSPQRPLSTSTSPASSSTAASSLSPLAASMLAHVHSPLCLGKPEEAIDVLRTGVSSSGSLNKLDEAALLLAWSDVEAARGELREAAERAALARDALLEAGDEEGSKGSSPLALCLRLLVEDARVRASLALAPSSSAEEIGGVSGSDFEALDVVGGGESRASSSALAEASVAGMRALLAHSRGEAEAARGEAEAVVKALGRLSEEWEEEEQRPPAGAAAAAAALASLAASRAAAVLLAYEETPAATELYSKAVALAERARGGKGRPAAADLLSPLAAADATLAALCGRAQARARAALPLLPPQDAQKDAGDALSAFDAEEKSSGGEGEGGFGGLNLRRPEAAALPLLLVLGQQLAGAGQVLVAEGLFRRGGKLLGIPKDRAPPPAAPPYRSCVHPSVAAALAWRHAQLLSALPRRESEAAELADAAARIWASSFSSASSSSLESSRASLEESMGTLDALTGMETRGKGIVVDAAARRVLPSLR